MLEIRKTMLSPSVTSRTLRECSLSTTFEMQGDKGYFDFPIVIHYTESVDDKPNGDKWLSHVVVNEDNTIQGDGGEHYDFWEELNTTIYEVLKVVAQNKENCGNDVKDDDLNGCCDIIFENIETTIEEHGIYLRC